MSRISFWTVAILVLSVPIAVQFGNWALQGEQDAAQSIQESAPAAKPAPLAIAPEPPGAGQGSGPVAESKLDIRFANGLLSVSVNNRALGPVLSEIARQSGIAFHVSSEIAAHPISVSLHGVPIEQGLVQILADFDSVHYFGARNSLARSDRAVWVYLRGQGFAAVRGSGRREAGQPADATSAYVSPVQLAANADPAIRLQAISALAEGGEPGVDQATARALLQAAFSDADPQVRAQALNGLVNQEPQAAFAYQAQGLRDADPVVRLMAVGTLAAQGQGLALLQAALNDPDEEVRVAARLQLEQDRPK